MRRTFPACATRVRTGTDADHGPYLVQVLVPDQNHAPLIDEIQAAVGKTGDPNIGSLLPESGHDEVGLNVELAGLIRGSAAPGVHLYLQGLLPAAMLPARRTVSMY